MNDTPQDHGHPGEPVAAGPQVHDRLPDTAVRRAAAFATDLVAAVLFCVMVVLVWVPFEVSCLFERVGGRKKAALDRPIQKQR